MRFREDEWAPMRAADLEEGVHVGRYVRVPTVDREMFGELVDLRSWVDVVAARIHEVGTDEPRWHALAPDLELRVPAGGLGLITVLDLGP